jgi:hypothetical protein
MDVSKLSDKGFLGTLERAIQFGKWMLIEGVAEGMSVTEKDFCNLPFDRCRCANALDLTSFALISL